MHIHEKGDTREKYFCEICNKMYLYRSSLRKHIQEHEEGLLGSVKDTASTNGESIEGNVLKAKEEPELEICTSKDSNRRKVIEIEDDEEEEDNDSLFKEPQPAKYVFTDNAEAMKVSSIEFQLDRFLQDSPKLTGLQQVPSPKVNVFPDSPSAYLYKPDYEPESEIKLAPLTPLLDSPLRDFGIANHSSDYQFLSIKPKNWIIKYKGELWYLYDRTLNKYKANGELVIRQIDNDETNPSGDHRLPEVSHYPDFESLIRVYKEIVSNSNGKITLDMLLSEKNCNSLNGENSHQDCKKPACEDHHDHAHDSEIDCDKFLASPKLYLDEFFVNSPLRNEESKITAGCNEHACLCEETRDYKHAHGPNCGHPQIWHDGHIDYIVDGKLHHHDGDHCSDHGPICVVENTNDDLAYGLISNTMFNDTKFKPAPLFTERS